MPITCCPVCGFDALSSKSPDQCPQCNADLVCFEALEALSEELPATSSEKDDSGSRKPRNRLPAKIRLYLITLLLLLCLGTGISVLMLDTLWFRPQPQPENSTNNISQKTYDDLLRRYTELSRHSAQPTNPEAGNVSATTPVRPKPAAGKTASAAATDTKQIKITTAEIAPPGKSQATDFFIYDCRDVDTLWNLAEQFYGNGKYYPVILEHNPNLSIYELGAGISLQIPLNLLQDRHRVDKLYQQITESGKGLVYWYYTICQRDTLASIMLKFYAKGLSTTIITDLNPEVEIKPGNKLKIIME